MHPSDPKPAAIKQPHSHRPQSHKRDSASGSSQKLNAKECLAAFVVFALWLVLFGGGIVVDTEPYRNAISPGGVKKSQAEAIALGDQKDNPKDNPSKAAGAESDQGKVPDWIAGRRGLIKSWFVVMLWYMPINLVFLCGVAGVLGAFGNRANLSDDRMPPPSRDNSNPYLSALLRGLFVYLVMISGLLLLDTNPFGNPQPGQYIRLAGFLSIFSFVVSYKPSIFSTLVEWASQRIEEREEIRDRHLAIQDITHTKATLEKTTVHAESKEGNDPQPSHASETDEARYEKHRSEEPQNPE